MFEAVPPGQKIPSIDFGLKPSKMPNFVINSFSMIAKQGAAV